MISTLDGQEYLTLNEAAEELQITRTVLNNFTLVSKELQFERRGIRYVVKRSELEAWKAQRIFSSVTLTREDYLKCLFFALKSFYHYRSTSDFGTAQQRDVGKFISNFVQGKLGEIAVEKFFKREFDVDIRLDFDIRDNPVGQDISELAKPRGNAIRIYNPPRKRIAIKTSKAKNVWLIVSENEVTDPMRESDYYIFARVDLHLDHLLRMLKEHSVFADLREIIPDFEDFSAQVCGFTSLEILKANEPVELLPNPKQAIGLSYILSSGELRKNKADWEELITLL